MDEWCRSYWKPVKAYLRVRGADETEAEEGTQEFFRRLLAKDQGLALPGNLSGAFRAHLKRSLTNFVTDRWRAQKRQKRGGDAAHFDVGAMEVSDQGVTPDLAFARAWALALIERAAKRLEGEMEVVGKIDFFRAVAGI